MLPALQAIFHFDYGFLAVYLLCCDGGTHNMTATALAPTTLNWYCSARIGSKIMLCERTAFAQADNQRER